MKGPGPERAGCSSTCSQYLDGPGASGHQGLVRAPQTRHSPAGRKTHFTLRSEKWSLIWGGHLLSFRTNHCPSKVKGPKQHFHMRKISFSYLHTKGLFKINPTVCDLWPDTGSRMFELLVKHVFLFQRCLTQGSTLRSLRNLRRRCD